MQDAAIAQRFEKDRAKLTTLQAIQDTVADELQEFRRYYRGAVRSPVGLLNTVVQYVLRQKGKRIRPTLVLLSAQACGGISEASYRAAALVELLHTATLVHDDVVDEAETRRGVFSVNALWKNKTAVLLGDYLLSRGLLLSLEHGDFETLRILSDSVRRMSEGELLQIEKARRMDIDEATYFRIISDKTASLISACAACGAHSASADPEWIESMRVMGESLGLAFQIRDDLFDYGAVDIGKPLGVDLQGRKLTLPLIYALRTTDPMRRAAVMKIIRKAKKSRTDRQSVIRFVDETGGLAYARERMVGFVHDAQEMLAMLPPTPARDALTDLAEYVIARKR